MISIIIPSFNEKKIIEKTLKNLEKLEGDFEVIIVDSSTDKTKSVIQNYLKKETTSKLTSSLKLLSAEKKGRSYQMNQGAHSAQGDIFIFLHADTILPNNALKLIQNSLARGCVGGGFQIKFDQKKWFLQGIEWYSKVRCILSQEYHGDQAIFVRKDVFFTMGGFPEIPIMEDPIFSQEMKKVGKTKFIQTPVITSARRITKAGFLRSLIIYFTMKISLLLRVSPHILARIYTDIR